MLTSSKKKKTFTEASGIMVDQVSGHCVPAKSTHKVNHCRTVPVFSEYWCSEKMGNQKWANYLQTCKTEFISQLCFREAQTSEGNTCTL